MDILEVVTQCEKFITVKPESKHEFLRKDKPFVSNGQGTSIGSTFPEVFAMNSYN